VVFFIHYALLITLRVVIVLDKEAIVSVSGDG